VTTTSRSSHGAMPLAATEARAARVSIIAAALATSGLASLHLLSPEFDPAWRVISEYALGEHGTVLSLMFLAWAASTWTLALAIAPRLRTRAGRIGLTLLVVSGLGQALAAVLELPHASHNIASLLGVPTFPVAALLVTRALTTDPTWAPHRTMLRWSAHATWSSLVLMILALVTLIVGYTRAGNQMTDDVIAVVGWTNRLLFLAYLAWAVAVARIGLGRAKEAVALRSAGRPAPIQLQ
jgi:hypothetical protein